MPRADLTRRQLVLGSMFLGVAGVAALRQPVPTAEVIPPDTLEAITPKQVGSWKIIEEVSVVLPPPDALSDRLYDNLVSRAYASDSEIPVLMVLAYSSTQDGVFQIHRPETCYPAGGFRLTQTQNVSLELGNGIAIPGSEFVANGIFRKEHVMYWTRQGDSFPQTWTQQKITMIEANLRGTEPDGMLARFSTINADPKRSKKAIEKFIATLLEEGGQELGRLLVGPLQG